MAAPQPRERACYVHVGTHKTGTTAIQRFFARHSDELARAGLYYPRAAWLSEDFPGHHNVAWELSGDPRFARAAGTLQDLAAELASVQPPAAYLSSEDFEYLHARAGALLALRDAVAGCGYRPRIVLYVRAQAEYAESLYAELAKHGLALSFERFLDGVVADGVVHHAGAWTFRFDYTHLAQRFAGVFGAGAVIVRGYRSGEPPARLVHDFMHATGGGAALAPDAAGDSVAYDNVRSTTGDVIVNLFRNTAAELGDARLAAAGAELVARNARFAAEPFAPLAPAARARVAARFAADNASLVRVWPDAAAMSENRGPFDDGLERARGARALFEHAETLRQAISSGPPSAARRSGLGAPPHPAGSSE